MFLSRPLSTIAFTVFSEIVIVFLGSDFDGPRNIGYSSSGSLFHLSLDGLSENASWCGEKLEEPDRLRKVRDFRLVLCADL